MERKCNIPTWFSSGKMGLRFRKEALRVPLEGISSLSKRIEWKGCLALKKYTIN